MNPNPTERPTPRTPTLTAANLACGAVVDGLLEQIAEGRCDQRSDHQQHCPHCAAALRELDAIWAPVRHHAAQPVAPPTGLTSLVMHQIRNLTRDAWQTLQVTDEGALRVAAQVVARLARLAAARVPGVVAAFGRARPPNDARAATGEQHYPHAAAGVLGRTAIVDVAVAVTYGQPIDEIAHRIQKQVISELRNNLGLERLAVNVSVDDIVASKRAHNTDSIPRNRGGFR